MVADIVWDRVRLGHPPTGDFAPDSFPRRRLLRRNLTSGVEASASNAQNVCGQVLA